MCTHVDSGNQHIAAISYKIVMAHRIATPSITFLDRDSIAIRADGAIETQDQAAKRRTITSSIQAEVE
jgi:hypothetical protein